MFDLTYVIVHIKTGFYQPRSGRPPHPPPYPKECKHFDYGLQHKIAIKRIFEDFKVGPSYYPNNI